MRAIGTTFDATSSFVCGVWTNRTRTGCHCRADPVASGRLAADAPVLERIREELRGELRPLARPAQGEQEAALGSYRQECDRIRAVVVVGRLDLWLLTTSVLVPLRPAESIVVVALLMHRKHVGREGLVVGNTAGRAS